MAPYQYLVALFAIFVHTVVIAQTRPEYVIKEDQPRTGSMIRRTAIGPIDVAYNLPYGQLPRSDKTKIHSQYEDIADGDEPPFPTDGLRAVLNPIRKAQERLLVQGELFLVATVGPDGKATQVRAYGSPSPEMTKFAAQVLMVVPYKPAICQGQPCTMDFPLNMRFALE